MEKVNVAVLGATGAVGRTMIRILQERRFPMRSLKLLASPHSAGKVIDLGAKTGIVEEFSPAALKLSLIHILTGSKERNGDLIMEFTLTRSQARQFYVLWQGLSGPYRWRTNTEIVTLIAQLGCCLLYTSADTLEELAGLMGVPADAFVETINHWNAMCEAGEDTDFHMLPSMMHPIKTAPFYANLEGAAALCTAGGLQITPRCV